MADDFLKDVEIGNGMENTDPYANPDEDKIVGEMKKLDGEMEYVLKKFHRQWFYQIAMRMGSQWLQYHPEGHAILPDNADGHVRMVINRILSIHQTKLGKMLKTDPWWECKADNTSYKSRKKARKGNHIAEYTYAEQKAKRKIKTLATWFLDTGTSFLYTFWDANLGEEVVEYDIWPGRVDAQGQAVDDVGQPQGFQVDSEGFKLDENGEKSILQTSKTGDARIEVVPPFDVTPYGIRHDGSYKGLIYTSEHATEDLKKQYPEFAKDIVSEKGDEERIKFYRQIQGLVSNEQHTTTEKKDPAKATFVSELFEEPSVTYPKGRHIIRICKKIVKFGPLPYKHLRIPLARFIDIENSGQPFGMGTVQNLCAPQKGFNRTWSQVIENFNAHANIKWKATKNAELEQEALDDSCEEVIMYNPGSTVEQISPAGMPSYVLNMMQNLYPQAFMDISGQHDVTGGEAPGEVRSGYGIQQLQASDDIRNQPTYTDFNAQLQEVGEQIIELYEEHLDKFNGREFEIRGTGRAMGVSGEDLVGMSRAVTIRTGTMLNSDMHQNKEQIMELWQSGLFGDPQDPRVRKKVMTLYEFGNMDSLFEDVDQDSEWAQEENDLLMSDDPGELQPYTPADEMKQMLDEQGKPLAVETLPVKEWEADKVHIDNHDSLRKTKEYRELPLEKQQMVDAHVDWHWDQDKKKNPPPPVEGQVKEAAPPIPGAGGIETPPEELPPA